MFTFARHILGSRPPITRHARSILTGMLALPLLAALGGCGQKGPLYLPAPTAHAASAPAPAPSSTTP